MECYITKQKINYQINILTDEIRCFGLDLLVASEAHFSRVRNMKAGEIDFTYSVGKDNVPRQGVGS